MIPYSINVFVILITYFIIQVIPIAKERKNKYFLFIAFFEFFLILAFRKPISDMIKYCQYYSIIGETSWKDLIYFSWEKGYIFLNKILYMINHSEQFFIIVTSALGLIGPYYFIKRYSKNYLMSVLLFIILSFFGYHYYVLRQMLALSVLLFSIRFIEERKLGKFILCVLLATSLHLTSILFLIGYFIFPLKITKKHFIRVMIIVAILIPLKGVLVKLVALVGYQEYIGVSTSDGYNLLIMMLGFLILFYIIASFRSKDKNEENTIFYNQFFLAVMLQVLATSQSVIARIVVDFYIAIIILIPNVIEDLKEEQKITIYGLMYLGIIVLAIISSGNLPIYQLNF